MLYMAPDFDDYVQGWGLGREEKHYHAALLDEHFPIRYFQNVQILPDFHL